LSGLGVGPGLGERGQAGKEAEVEGGARAFVKCDDRGAERVLQVAPDLRVGGIGLAAGSSRLLVFPRLNWPTTASWNLSPASRASSSLARFSVS
jgi:hypothetical protein